MLRISRRTMRPETGPHPSRRAQERAPFRMRGQSYVSQWRASLVLDLVARGLYDRLPERGVGGEFLGEAVWIAAHRDQAERDQFLPQFRLGQRPCRGLA